MDNSGSGESRSSKPAEQLRRTLRAGRLAEAVQAAERLLDEAGDKPETLELLGNNPLGLSPYRPLELSRLRRRLGASAGSGAGGAIWPRLWAAHILHKSGREDEALAGLGWMDRVPPRYAWMRSLRGHLRLHRRSDYAGAAADIAVARAASPALWRCDALLAEIALCRGRRGEAFKIMDRLARSLPEPHRGSARAWRGEMSLWLGSYAAALKDLRPAVAAGAMFARCWLGAALLQLGRTREGLRELDRSLKARPDDPEALVWRAEARLRLGRPREALKDLGKASSLEEDFYWASALAGLAHAALGATAASAAELAAIRPEVATALERRCGLRLHDKGQALAAAAKLLELGRGLRRWEPYLIPIWAR